MRRAILIQFIKQFIDELIKALKEFWFECLTKARFDLIEIKNEIEAEDERQERFEPVYQEQELAAKTEAEAEIERKERFGPVYQENEIDEKLQTGESRLLGGEMRLAAKWVIEAEEDKSHKTY